MSFSTADTLHMRHGIYKSEAEIRRIASNASSYQTSYNDSRIKHSFYFHSPLNSLDKLVTS